MCHQDPPGLVECSGGSPSSTAAPQPSMTLCVNLWGLPGELLKYVVYSAIMVSKQNYEQTLVSIFQKRAGGGAYSDPICPDSGSPQRCPNESGDQPRQGICSIISASKQQKE